MGLSTPVQIGGGVPRRLEVVLTAVEAILDIVVCCVFIWCGGGTWSPARRRGPVLDRWFGGCHRSLYLPTASSSSERIPVLEGHRGKGLSS